MADAQLKLSRRAVLGAVCLAPLAPVLSEVEGPKVRHSGLDPESMNTAVSPARTAVSMDSGLRRNDGAGNSFAVTKWERALDKVQKAQAALDALAGVDDDSLYDRVLGRFNKALSRLLRTPAPHPAALAEKLDVLVAHQAWELNFAESAFVALRRDARRFAWHAG